MCHSADYFSNYAKRNGTQTVPYRQIMKISFFRGVSFVLRHPFLRSNWEKYSHPFEP